MSVGARLFGRTYVRHSTLFLRSTFVGLSEFIRQDFRPPLVFFPFGRLFVGWGEFFTRLFPFCSTFCRLGRVFPAGLSSATRLFSLFLDFLSAGSRFTRCPFGFWFWPEWRRIMLASRSRLRVGAFGSAYSAPKNLGIGSTPSDVEDAAPTGARNNQPALLDRDIGSTLFRCRGCRPHRGTQQSAGAARSGGCCLYRCRRRPRRRCRIGNPASTAYPTINLFLFSPHLQGGAGWSFRPASLPASFLASFFWGGHRSDEEVFSFVPGSSSQVENEASGSCPRVRSRLDDKLSSLNPARLEVGRHHAVRNTSEVGRQ